MPENASFWQRNTPSLTRRKGFIAITDLPDYAPSQDTTILSSQEACNFWKKHFGSPPRTPYLHVREEWLEADLSAGAIGIKLTDKKGEIIGTIWARPIGNFYVTTEPTHQIPILYVEGLCLKPEARGKGYTRQLLNALGTETLKRYGPEMRFLFLKEGHSIPTSTLGFDLYIYKRFSNRDSLNATIKTPLALDKAKEIFRTLTQKKNINTRIDSSIE
jgi:GNAT superfamily N-acetyltransferase